ncbi:hypothetical protein H257_15619 [Aphanomyces astaci]|uniref:Methyltransferase type 11 domain-containing protein n=1 Tax=Aphanomyces astaci TaxID=112090 RepID=W4FLV8_APHAT|nr:hypothetical protein H257_15619 [Aphanomyces astaci]ETV68460.1 hypothetical protein H257_15619 [Aphanomyces astaci]|eukprot:XP_009842086.1 hypothetical protein H257_15619 [Aphanomyces astaci]
MLRRQAKTSSKKVAKDRPRRLSDDGDSGRRTSDADLGGATYDDQYENGDVHNTGEGSGGSSGGGWWINCECFLSLLLVAVLVALPFNLHNAKDLLQSRDSYIVKAVEMIRVGACDDAVTLYERALIVEESATIHNQLADALSQCGRTNDALKHYMSSIRLEETGKRKVPSLMAVGDLYLKNTDYSLASKSFETIVSILQDEPTKDLVEAYMKLAKVDIGLRRFSTAYSHYTAASDLIIGDSMQAEVHYRMGHIALVMNRLPLAIDNFNVATTKGTPAQRSLFTHSLAYAYLEHGMLVEGNHALASLFASPSMYTEERYIRASFQDHHYPSGRTPSQYLSQLFDLYAYRHSIAAASSSSSSTVDTFRHLHGLLFESSVPAVMSAALRLRIGISDGDHWLDVVDFGCGSGHAMAWFRSLSSFVLGIDVSPMSIENARQLSLYDDLQIGDILDVGGHLPDASYDLVLAINALPYFGDLRQVFELAHRILRPEAIFAFNVDLLPRPDDDEQEHVDDAFSLRFSGRWTHNDAYIKQIVQQHGFVLLHEEQVDDDQPFFQPAPGVIQRRPYGKERSNVYLVQKLADHGV